ncbi:PstS family phosphate ABC transporter substrate-binding protein [Ruminiclostridium cellulolyticum]|uniref:Phosphate-binding protein n=1 Tax=Ruminiclostridium cellulolyticum (strain ATCC 35319 / DSM 5812 / JCM 6584 / H10) TaxID=394503 RepID=B8I413_RUMCH|nr:PstS family phosphate ABC transporter substrate-binding protein [Ruminiclostridium cellulolyticum]ACL76446.1 phosphate binding protein [Ruminiclostridium cellulolyticum H10]
MAKLVNKKRIVSLVLGVALTVSLTACGDNTKSNQDVSTKLTGKIVIDGSSTVYPVSSAVAEEFQNEQPDVEVSVAMSGTGGGMKKFAAGEIDICDASRKIKPEEAEAAKAKGIDFVELEVAYDGISVVVNKDNTWAESITVDELNKIWGKDSKVKTWKEVNPAWPDEPLKLYGPGTDSGTFEFFTEVINKKAKESRTDYTPSEDDNVLVQGIAGDKDAMGYFGFAYYEENQDSLRVLKIDSGKGPIEPNLETIKNNTYSPLSRPLYIYVNKNKINQSPVKEFIEFYLDNAGDLAKEVGYVPLESYDAEKAKLK